MSKSTKIWLVIGALFIFLGTAIFGGVMLYLGGNYNKLSTAKYQTTTFSNLGEFNSILIDVTTADIEIKQSDTLESKVVVYDQENVGYSAVTIDGVLEIKATDNRTWRDYLGISFTTSKVTIYLEKATYYDLLINASTGDVSVMQSFTFNSINVTLSTGDVNISNATILEEFVVNVTTGDVEIKNCTLKKFTSKGGTGDIELDNVIAIEHFTIERSTGDVEFIECDAYELFIKTSTGDIKGTLLSEKKFNAKTNTGKKRVPSTLNGGDCVLNTSTGDIIISIVN